MKPLLLSFLAAVVLVGGALYATGGVRGDAEDVGEIKNNVSVVDGKQIVEIRARGGYIPEKSVAKAGIPTVIRFMTKGTFDCSSSVRIPSMDVSVRLPASGATDIELGTPKAGLLQGMCSMGMYPFEILFEE